MGGAVTVGEGEWQQLCGCCTEQSPRTCYAALSALLPGTEPYGADAHNSSRCRHYSRATALPPAKAAPRGDGSAPNTFGTACQPPATLPYRAPALLPSHAVVLVAGRWHHAGLVVCVQ
jgi:hypothetical protein